MKEVQLFFLPFAGGNSTSFKKLMPFLDTRIEDITIEYAGRLSRSSEAYITDYDDFLKDVALQIKKYRKFDMPYAVFGYSFGSILAYDLLANQLIDGLPLHVFICAKGSPFTKPISYTVADYPDKKFFKDILELGGIDEKIFSDTRFLEVCMRPIRADYIALGKYRYKNGRISCDATAIYSEKDKAALGVEDWALIVDKSIDFYKMGSNHFFINEYFQEVADIVNSHLFKC